jgi:hypothetical protein
MTAKTVRDLSADPQARADAAERRLQRHLTEVQRAVRRHAHQRDLSRVEGYSAVQAQRRDELARLEQQPELQELLPQWPDRLAPVAVGAVLGLCTLLPGAEAINAAILAASAALVAVLADRSGQRAANAVHGLQADAPGWKWAGGCLGLAALALGSAALAEARHREADGFSQALAAVVGAAAAAGAAMISLQWRELTNARWANRKRAQQIVEARQLLEAARSNYQEHVDSDSAALFAAADGLEQAIGDQPAGARRADGTGGQRSRASAPVAQLADRAHRPSAEAQRSDQAA